MKTIIYIVAAYLIIYTLGVVALLLMIPLAVALLTIDTMAPTIKHLWKSFINAYR